MRGRHARAAAGALALMLTATACGGRTAAPTRSVNDTRPAAVDSPAPFPFADPLPGMPAVIGGDVYAADRAGEVQPRIAHDPAYLYVPNSYGAPTTTVIDQRTHRIVRVLNTGTLSQHVTPSYDLKTLYVEASVANQIVAINPRTGRIEHRYRQPRPYNLYFTPDGRRGIVMEEQDNRIDFTNPHTFKLIHSVSDPRCKGPNHADFSANGRFFLVTCEFSGVILRISTLHPHVTGILRLPAGSMPQDLRLSPTGRDFYVASMMTDEVLRISARHRLRIIGRIHTPSMPHGIYPSRDGRFLYVSDRGAGEVSVISVRGNRIVDTWKIPGGGTPDMGGLSADGKTLWLSGRRDGYVYGWNTRTGKLIARIRVGGQPHGLLVWPQPGRYSLGHTGNMR